MSENEELRQRLGLDTLETKEKVNQFARKINRSVS